MSETGENISLESTEHVVEFNIHDGGLISGAPTIVKKNKDGKFEVSGTGKYIEDYLGIKEWRKIYTTIIYSAIGVRKVES